VLCRHGGNATRNVGKSGHHEVVPNGHRPTQSLEVPVPMISESHNKEMCLCRKRTEDKYGRVCYIAILRNVHGFPKEEVDDIKRQIAEEAALRATNYRWVVCPICNEKFINHTGLALHISRQSYKGSDGGEDAQQDYRGIIL
ncbi:hypothetical protein COOONC_11919, partial [Cooperia oncophora]